MAKASNQKNNKKKKQENSDNEIIIGVTTAPKEKVRVDRKTTRTNTKKNQKASSKSNNGKKNTRPKKNKKIYKEEEIRKKNRKRMTISCILLLFLAIGGTIYYLTTPVFNIAHIEVYGNEKNSIETYISLSRIEIGTTNIFGITSNKIKKNIKENAYAEEIVMKRKLPNIIQLYITERKVSYQVELSGNYLYLDNQGYILEISQQKKDVPTIKGLSSIQENVQAGQRLAEEDLLKLNTVLKIMNYCKYNTIENEITSIDVTDKDNYIMYFEKDKKIVYLGDASNLSERLSMLKTILKNEKDKQGEIFMNGDLKEDRIYFREKK